ncbi:MAG: hypothetical protein Q8R57_15970, partial [Bacteroidota bacterium]|nr:hypothetical protein [Bacteroidota bacterium]
GPLCMKAECPLRSTRFFSRALNDGIAFYSQAIRYKGDRRPPLYLIALKPKISVILSDSEGPLCMKAEFPLRSTRFFACALYDSITFYSQAMRYKGGRRPPLYLIALKQKISVILSDSEGPLCMKAE